MQTKVSGVKRDVFAEVVQKSPTVSTKKPLGLITRLVRDAEH